MSAQSTYVSNSPTDGSRVLSYSAFFVHLTPDGQFSLTVILPCLALPCLAQVSVVLQQRKEEAQRAAEEAEALARFEKEAEAATNPTVETDGAEAKATEQV
jgi:hypothetical protein